MIDYHNTPNQNRRKTWNYREWALRNLEWLGNNLWSPKDNYQELNKQNGKVSSKIQ